MSTPSPRASARDNPWYVLATIMGEPTGSSNDKALQAANRRVWNSWASQELSEKEKREKAGESRHRRDLFEGVEPWSEICGRIEAEFKKRLPDTEIPDPSESVDFGNLSFEAPVSFDLFFFKEEVSFSDASFTEAADFRGASFTKAADFIDATFTETAYFTGASFAETAYFTGASFTETADFRGTNFTKDAYFRGTSFTKDAYFTGATFTETAYFTGASFTKDANFSRATFTETAYFTGATFTETAYFTGATFTETAYFNGATFEGRSYFQEVEFKGSVDFTDVGFDKPCNLREAKFTKEYPRLEGTNLHAKTTITADDNHWPPKNTDEKYKGAMTSCAHLRHNMAAQGLPEHAHFFFRREMALKSRTVSRWGKGWYWAYRISSDFGHSLQRPFWGLFFLWVLMAVVLCLVDIPAPSALNPLQLSFANMFPSFLFSAREHLHVPWLEWLMWFQTILGTVLVFLFILGLRNRFRL